MIYCWLCTVHSVWFDTYHEFLPYSIASLPAPWHVETCNSTETWRLNRAPKILSEEIWQHLQCLFKQCKLIQEGLAFQAALFFFPGIYNVRLKGKIKMAARREWWDITCPVLPMVQTEQVKDHLARCEMVTQTDILAHTNLFSKTKGLT